MIKRELVFIGLILFLTINSLIAQKFNLKASGAMSYQSANGFSVEYDGLYFELLPTEEGSDFFMPALEFSFELIEKAQINLNLAYGEYTITTLSEDRKILGGPSPATKVTGQGYPFLATTVGMNYALLITNKFSFKPLFGIIWQHGFETENYRRLPRTPEYERRAWEALEQSRQIINRNQFYFEFGVSLYYQRFGIFYKQQRPFSNSLGSITIEGQELSMYSKRYFNVVGLSFEFLRF